MEIENQVPCALSIIGPWMQRTWMPCGLKNIGTLVTYKSQKGTSLIGLRAMTICLRGFMKYCNSTTES